MKKIINFSIFIVFVLFLIPFSVSASSLQNMSGFAWSSNIGWVSFSSTNDHDPTVAGIQPSATDYGVNLDPSTGYLSGYAWSSNIGWIQFGGLSGFPAGSGTTADNAKMVGSNIVGWARALSATDAGWDGWISMSGTTVDGGSYGVSQSGVALSGFAWGSSVVGWLSFNSNNSGGVNPGNVNFGVTFGGGLDTISFDAIGNGSTNINGLNNVPGDTAVSLKGTISSNVPANTTCSISKTSSGGTELSPSQLASSTKTWILNLGDISGTNPISYAYKLTCSDGLSYLDTRNVAFTVLPQVPSFTLGGNENISIDFSRSAGADSEIKTIHVYPVGGFSSNVNISVDGIYPSINTSTTTYSFGGGAFYEHPSPVTIQYNSETKTYGTTAFRIHLSSFVDNACGPVKVSGCTQYTITIRAVSADDPNISATKTYTINQAKVNAGFKEI